MDVIPSDESGVLDLAALEEILIAGRVKVVAITHVPTNGGVINPAKEGTCLSMLVVPVMILMTTPRPGR